MADRRTTLVAREEDLATLAHEARARGLSLGRLLGEVVGERAEQLRHDRRPRLGTFAADADIARDSMHEGPETRPFRDA
ncbi:MAG: hypothetical protein ACYDC2_06065 [Solirubrobacteraceae bacterium]